MSELTEESVQEALKDVIDPELGYNIVELGLIYGITIQDNRVDVIMTMTTPGCPATNYIQEGAHERLLSIEGIKDAHVDIVWSPPWDPSMMSDDAKQHFGFA